MHRSMKILCCSLLLLTAGCSCVLTSCGNAASSSESQEKLDPDKCGTFVGKVYKEVNGDFLSGVRVTAEHIKSKETYSVKTDSAGEYELMVPAGKYTLNFSLEGYSDVTTHMYKVKKGATVETDEEIRLASDGNSSGSPQNASETPVNTLDVLDTPTAYGSCDEAYSAFIDGILARSEYRGIDGKPVSGFAEMIDYVRFDMNHDGVDELIITTGSKQVDRAICFYTFRDNMIRLIGYNFSGYYVSNYLCDNETQQLVTEWNDEGRGGAAWYHYDGETVRITKETGPISYESGETPSFAENCTKLDFKTGYRSDSGWIFE